MAKLISADTRLDAWLHAAEHLLTVGSELNLILDIKSPGSDGPVGLEAQKRMDAFYSEASRSGEKGVYPIHTVAETIFPGWEYSKRGLAGIYKNYGDSYSVIKSGWGTYAHRLLWRKAADGTVVQPLTQLIGKMKSEHKNPGPKTACYELGVAEGAYDMPLYNSVDDAAMRMKLPCLSHLSFKLDGDKVHLTALYRSHDYRLKVPGNLLGLARLQACVAREVRCEIGSLVVHSTYAWIHKSKEKLKGLVDELNALGAQGVKG